MNIKIFLFHRVSPKKDPLWAPIPPEQFDSIIDYIAKNHTVVSLENHIIFSKELKPSSKKIAAIVFDDGYKDFLEYALPILKKHNCPASMYVVSDCVTTQVPPWTYILDYHFSNSKKLELKLNFDFLPENLHVQKFNNQDEKLKFAKDFKLQLKMIPNSQRVALFEQTISSLDDVSIPKNLMLNWDELLQIKNEGVEIGSHSMTHPLLAKLENESDLINEIKGSALIIEKMLGKFPLALSYPIGSYNETTKRIAKEAGYKMGLAVNQQFYDSSKNDLFEIPRVEIYSQSNLKTKFRILGLTSKINNWLK